MIPSLLHCQPGRSQQSRPCWHCCQLSHPGAGSCHLFPLTSSIGGCKTVHCSVGITCRLLLRFELNTSYQTEVSITHQTVFPLTKAAYFRGCLCIGIIDNGRLEQGRSLNLYLTYTILSPDPRPHHCSQHRWAWLSWEQCHHRCLHSWAHSSAGSHQPSFPQDKTQSRPNYPNCFLLRASTLSKGLLWLIKMDSSAWSRSYKVLFCRVRQRYWYISLLDSIMIVTWCIQITSWGLKFKAFEPKIKHCNNTVG